MVRCSKNKMGLTHALDLHTLRTIYAKMYVFLCCFFLFFFFFEKVIQYGIATLQINVKKIKTKKYQRRKVFSSRMFIRQENYVKISADSGLWYIFLLGVGKMLTIWCVIRKTTSSFRIWNLENIKYLTIFINLVN